MSESDYFTAMFATNEWLESKTNSMRLEETLLQPLINVLKMSYGFRVDTNEWKLQEMNETIITANRYQFRRIESMLSAKVIQRYPKMNDKNAVEVMEMIRDLYEMSKMCHLFDLREECLHYWDTNADRVIESLGKLYLGRDLVLEVLSRDTFGVHEVDIFMGLVEYLIRNKSVLTFTAKLSLLRVIRFEILTDITIIRTINPVIKSLATKKIFGERLIECLIDDVKQKHKRSRGRRITYKPPKLLPLFVTKIEVFNCYSFEEFILLFIPFLSYGLLNDSKLFEAINSAFVRITNRSTGPTPTSLSSAADVPAVCYEDIDCFAKNGPLRHIGTLPAPPDKINTRFFAFSRYSTGQAFELNVKHPQSLSIVAQEQALAILIHGFANDANKTELLALKDSLLYYTYVNTVIIVDWSRGALAPWYTEAATNTQVVGRQITLLVESLRRNGRTNPFNVHLFGFSLGAQIAGFAGKYSQMKYKWKFGRISALDAAGPLFEGYPGSYLTKSDAYFVDAIHTSAGNNILKGELGFLGPIGHIDFYPNNGTRQPRCQKRIVSTCDHNSALYYMESSLRSAANCTFVAFKCNSWLEYVSGKCSDRIGVAVMGYLSVLARSGGNHYLKTTAKYPFCWDYKLRRKQFGIKTNKRKSMSVLKGRINE
ncbi:unnamed protein product [Oppiella nova]|uniref:Uncharacterized protein n=1 Tax=Oppiella nova TaxID=334625 RepID=A0A7R9LZP8_9ACAR|nr:unnamed protein product [Oppiella nova]CAG2168260.1 unnamed protein product [Oppiella nova]